MREGYKTPKECAEAWVKGFLTGKEHPTRFHNRMMKVCNKCKDFGTCFPPPDKWDDSMKRFARDMMNALIDEA
jgi:hypothetical protein